MPLIRRIPKKGFTAPFRKTYQVVNVYSLNRFEANAIVGPSELKKAGLIGSEKELIKILGKGSLEKQLTVKAHKFSGSAKSLIESACARAEVIDYRLTQL